MNKTNIISIILIIVTLLSATAYATETTYRHTGFEVWGFDINFTKLNVTNIGVLGFQQAGAGVPPISGADKAWMYYDAATDKVKISENGETYYNVLDRRMDNYLSPFSNSIIYNWVGSVFDSSNFTKVDTALNIYQNNGMLNVSGSSSWGANGMYSNMNYTRPFITIIKWSSNGSGQINAVGVKDAGIGVSYTNFVYSIIPTTAGVGIYENGVDVGGSATRQWTVNTQYWLRINVTTTGANYSNSIDGINYTPWYNSTYNTTAPLKIGAAGHSGTLTLRNISVSPSAARYLCVNQTGAAFVSGYACGTIVYY